MNPRPGFDSVYKAVMMMMMMMILQPGLQYLQVEEEMQYSIMQYSVEMAWRVKTKDVMSPSMCARVRYA